MGGHGVVKPEELQNVPSDILEVLFFSILVTASIQKLFSNILYL